MNTIDKNKRTSVKAISAGIFVVTTGGIWIPNRAHADPVLVLGLINALISLYSVISQRETALAQLKGSTEVARNQNYSDFNMQNSDPNKVIQTYGNGGTLPLNCQGQVSKEASLTVQDGIPYLHPHGRGNQPDSNVNRWEVKEFSRIAREETGVLPIPAGQRDPNLSMKIDEMNKLLERKGLDPKIWRPMYTRNIKLKNADQSIVVATNVYDRKAILV